MVSWIFEERLNGKLTSHLFRQELHTGERNDRGGHLPGASRSVDLGPGTGKVQPGSLPAGELLPKTSVRVRSVQCRSTELHWAAVRVDFDEDLDRPRAQEVPAEDDTHDGIDQDEGLDHSENLQRLSGDAGGAKVMCCYD